MIFFFLKRSHRSALLSVVQQLTSHITDDDCDDEADDTGAGGEAVFDMECQNISTHIAGIRQSIESDVSVNRDDETTSSRSSPVFRRRAIHDVKSTASLQALRTYNGCDEDDDEPEDPLASTAGHTDDEIIVAGGFSSPVIKYVHCTLQFLLANR